MRACFVLLAACSTTAAPQLANRAGPKPEPTRELGGPVVCQFERSRDTLGGLCLGIPVVGGRIIELDTAAELVVTSVSTADDPAACPLSSVGLQLVRGELVPLHEREWTGIVVDPSVTKPSRVEHDSQHGETLFAIDRDGDRTLDYVAVESVCRHGGRDHDCVDVWTRGSRELVHASRVALGDPACAVNNQSRPRGKSRS